MYIDTRRGEREVVGVKPAVHIDARSVRSLLVGSRCRLCLQLRPKQSDTAPGREFQPRINTILLCGKHDWNDRARPGRPNLVSTPGLPGLAGGNNLQRAGRISAQV